MIGNYLNKDTKCKLLEKSKNDIQRIYEIKNFLGMTFYLHSLSQNESRSISKQIVSLK